MTYNQYWYGDPLMVKAFYEADKIRRKRENELAWLNGLYVFKAVEATVGNFGKKKNAKPIEYPNKPIDFDSERRIPKEQKKAAEEERTRIERQRLIDKLNSVRDEIIAKNKG